MAEQWTVHLFPITGAGVLEEGSSLTFDGDQLWFRRRDSRMPEPADVTWIGGELRAEGKGCKIVARLRTLPEMGRTILHGSARGELIGEAGTGAPGGEDIDSFVAVRAGGDSPGGA